MGIRKLSIYCLLRLGSTAAFFFSSIPSQRPSTIHFAGAGKGFGKTYQSKKSQNDDSKGSETDLIDTEFAMADFFSSNNLYHPLFQSFAQSESVPAMSYMGDVVREFDFQESSAPWRRLEGIPTTDQDRQVVASFLDNMQQSLVDIPVDETTKDDENDRHFIEEGRRLLVLSRFHVFQGTEQSHDSLFSVCWSELMHLREMDEDNSGSLILVPGSDIVHLQRFTDMNLQQPLKWLGMDEVFEVSSFQRGSPAIRLIHKLSDIPDISKNMSE